MTARSRHRRAASKISQLLRSRTSIVVGFSLATNVLRIVSSVILSRLLSAEDFGIVGIVTSVTVILAMISDIGLMPFVLRHKDGRDRQFLDEVWTLRIIRSAVLTGAVVCLAWPIAHILGKPELGPIIALAGALSIGIDGLVSLAFITALQNREVLRLSIVDLTSAIIQLTVAGVLAYFMRDYWALFIGTFAAALYRVVLSYTAFPDTARRWRFSRARAVEMFQFARYITPSSIMTLAISQIDKVVAARLFSLPDFGLYVLAGNLAAAPLVLGYAYQQRVVWPKFAEVWREAPAALGLEFYKSRWAATALYMFAVGGLVGSAPLVIEILYDPRYLSASIYLELLALAPLFALNTQSINDVFIARGEPWHTLAANLIRGGWLAIMGVCGYLAFGVIGLVAAVGLIEVPALIFGWIKLARIGFLNWRYEAIFLLAAGIGVAIGRVVALVGTRFVS